MLLPPLGAIATSGHPEPPLSRGVVLIEVGQRYRPAAVRHPRPGSHVDGMQPHALAVPELGRATEIARAAIPQAGVSKAQIQTLVQICGVRPWVRRRREVTAGFQHHHRPTRFGDPLRQGQTGGARTHHQHRISGRPEIPGRAQILDHRTRAHLLTASDRPSNPHQDCIELTVAGCATARRRASPPSSRVPERPLHTG